MKRRRVLQVMAGSTGVGLAGCADLPGDEGGDQPAYGDSPGQETSDDEESTVPDDTSPENEPPSIVDFDAEPTEYGTTLRVSLEGEDDQGIKRAAISYGNLGIEKMPDDTPVVVEENLTDIHEADLDETPGTVVFRLEDTEGEITEETNQPYTGFPSVSIESAASSTTGEPEATIRATDEIGLHWVEVDVNDDPVEKINITGSDESVHELSLTGDSIVDGKMNEVTTTVRNTFGNTSSVTRDQYVREFEPIKDQEIEIGAHYLPFFDDPTRWTECTDAEPEVGRYSMSDEEAVSRHVDLMQGFGISRMMHQFTVPENSIDLLNTLDDSIGEEMPLEVYYNFANAMAWRGSKTIVEQFEDTTSFLQSELLEREGYNNRDGRPVVTLWDVTAPAWAGSESEIDDAIHSEWGGYEGFADFLYGSLETGGEEPYLVGMINGVPSGGVPSAEAEMARQFDAITNWFIHVESGENIAWEDAIEEIEDEYNYLRKFSDENDMEFIPTAYPGFDDSANGCWGENRKIERDASHLKDTLHLADKCGSTDRINIATFNDWPEGHMLEPGTFKGKNHGTDYLEVVQEFVMGEQER